MRRKRIDLKARGIVCAVKRANVIGDNIRARGASRPASTGRRHDRTHDQTHRRKITLDQRAPSRHDNAIRRHAPSVFSSRGAPLTVAGSRGWRTRPCWTEWPPRLKARPDILARRRETVEHPFGTIKQWMNQGAFLMKGLDNVRAEFSLTALVYNLRRSINILGVDAMMAAVRG
jgi:hypothetical protein